MKIFGKTVTGKEKKALIAQILAVVLGGVFLVMVGVLSFAWFASNTSVNQNGMDISVHGEDADVLVERATEYDTGYDGIVGSAGLKAGLAAAGYSTSYSDTTDSSLLAYELITEYVFEGKKYMMPGAYGKMTFYLRPKTGRDGSTIRFKLDLGGYVNGFDGDDPVVLPVTSDRVKTLLKGHVLFFTDRTGADYSHFKYTGLIDNGTFSYDMSQHSKCGEVGKTDCYKITLYWEWPVTFYDIAYNISTMSPAVEKKYPPETSAYLTDHPDYFFPIGVEDDDGSKSDAYNDGDQTIGDGMDYFVAYLSME